MNLIESLPIDPLQAIGLNPRTLAQLGQLDLTPALAWLRSEAQGHDRPEPAADPADSLALMRITTVHRETVDLHDGFVEHPARPLPALRQALAADEDALAVGDWVIALRNRHRQWWVWHRLAPLTQLARRVSDERNGLVRTVIASNVDTALLVQGLDGDFNLRRLERYLALVRLAGITPVVVLTKADLCAEVEDRIRAVQGVLPPDGAVVAVNALGTEPRERLAPWLRPGSTLVLMGSSGVGKSTLTNSLTGASEAAVGDTAAAGAPQAQRTGATRAGDDRGKHTTTARSLHRTPDGACIIDTPGLRTLRLGALPEELASSFDDIAALAQQCRFADCRHESEPGCAVRAALSPERLRNFHKLMRESRRDAMTVLERQALHAQWRVRSRAARRREADKRGAR